MFVFTVVILILKRCVCFPRNQKLPCLGPSQVSCQVFTKDYAFQGYVNECIQSLLLAECNQMRICLVQSTRDQWLTVPYFCKQVTSDWWLYVGQECYGLQMK